MLLQALALVVVYFVSLSHYHAGKAILITLFIGITAFILYFLFNMVGIMLISLPASAVDSLKNKHKKRSEAEKLMRGALTVSSGKAEYRLPFCAIIVLLLSAVTFNLLKVSTFMRGLFYLTFALYAVLSYLDKVFTHLPNRFIPAALETSIYFFVAFAVLHVS